MSEVFGVFFRNGLCFLEGFRFMDSGILSLNLFVLLFFLERVNRRVIMIFCGGLLDDWFLVEIKLLLLL